MLSIIIPNRGEKYLQKTIDDLFTKAKGEIEVLVVFDGYTPRNAITKARCFFQERMGMRGCINYGMAHARGEYVMKTDGHCMFDEGFDIKLIADCEPNWVVTPRRYRLDPDNWKFLDDGRPPVDYMYTAVINGNMHGWKDVARGEERKDILIDDTMTMQGSCYFMHKKYWDEMYQPLDDVNYGPFSGEAQEITCKCWLSGGRVVVNKKTWYAHWYRTENIYEFSPNELVQFNRDLEKGRLYNKEFWLGNKWDKRVHDYVWLVDKFKPPTRRALG